MERKASIILKTCQLPKPPPPNGTLPRTAGDLKQSPDPSLNFVPPNTNPGSIPAGSIDRIKSNNSHSLPIIITNGHKGKVRIPAYFTSNGYSLLYWNKIMVFIDFKAKKKRNRIHKPFLISFIKIFLKTLISNYVFMQFQIISCSNLLSI